MKFTSLFFVAFISFIVCFFDPESRVESGFFQQESKRESRDEIRSLESLCLIN